MEKTLLNTLKVGDRVRVNCQSIWFGDKGVVVRINESTADFDVRVYFENYDSYARFYHYELELLSPLEQVL